MKIRKDTSSALRGRSGASAFTLVELLMVVAIIGLSLGAILPALGSFFDSARGPDARNLMSVSLMGARNYAVANNITTALVFTEDTSETKPRVRVYLAEYDSTDGDFEVVRGQETRYLPVEILISDDDTKDNPEYTVVICFSAVGQLTVVSSPTISSPPIPTIGSGDSVRSCYMYDGSVGDSPMELLEVNYYTGELIGR